MWGYLRSSKLFIVGAVLIVGALATCAAAVWESGKRREIAERGVQVEATITDKQRVQGSRGRTRREVHLRFTDANSVEHTITRSDESLWRKEVGDTAQLIYLPDDPRTTRLPGQAGASELFMLAGVLAAAGAGMSLLATRRAAGRP